MRSDLLPLPLVPPLLVLILFFFLWARPLIRILQLPVFSLLSIRSNIPHSLVPLLCLQPLRDRPFLAFRSIVRRPTLVNHHHPTALSIMKTLSLILVLAIAHLLPVTARRLDVTGSGSFNPSPIYLSLTQTKPANNHLLLPGLTHLTTPAWPVATTSHLLIHHAENPFGNLVLRSDSTESEEPARSTITTTVMNITTTTTVYVNSSTPLSGPVLLSETDPLGIVFGTVTTTEESEIPSVPTLQGSSTHTSSVMTITGPSTDTDIMTIETETATYADSPEVTGETVLASTEPEYPIPTAANSSFSQVDNTVIFNSTLLSTSETFDIATAAATATNNSLETGQSTTATSCFSTALLTMVTPLTDSNDTSVPEPTSSSHPTRPHPTPHHTTSGNTTSSTTTDTLMATATANSNAGARSLSQPARLFGFLTRILMLLQVNLSLDPADRHLAQATTIDSSTEQQQSTESQSATTTISTTSSTTSTTTTTLTYTSTTSVNTTSTIDLPTLPCTTNPDPAVPVTCTASSLPYNGTVTFAYGNATDSSGGVASYNASSAPTPPAATSSSQPSSSTSHRPHATPSLMSGASGPGSWSESTFYHRVTPFMVHLAIVALRLWHRW